MKLFNYLLLFAYAAASLMMSSCAFDKEPATPKQTFETYVRALKKKDITTMKLLLSKDTLKMHEQEAKAAGVTLDDIVKRETLIGEGQSTVVQHSSTRTSTSGKRSLSSKRTENGRSTRRDTPTN
jgi:hypothetical protein